MRRLPRLFVVVFLGAGACTARAAEEPRALVERAIRAQGGEQALAHRDVHFVKFKGQTWLDPADQPIPLAGTVYSSHGGQRQKADLTFDLMGERHEIHTVLDLDKGWESSDGQAKTLPAEEVARRRASWHQERVADLVPLLRDPGFTLTGLGEEKVDGRPAR